MKKGTKGFSAFILSTLAIAVLSVFVFHFANSQNSTINTQLSDFEAYMIDDVAFVTWTTSAEAKDEEITLEKSTNGKDFSTIKKFILNGVESKYTFVHHSPNFGLSYYRIQHSGVGSDQNITPLINHDGPVNFDVVREDTTIKLTTDHYGDGTYLVSITDITGKHYFMQSLTFNSANPAIIDTKKMGLKSQEYIVRLHSTEWSTDKRIII